MPLARRQFELGIDPDIEKWMWRVFGFLEGHKDEAFSSTELADTFDVPEHVSDIKLFYEWDDNHRRFLQALQRLVELQAVSEREVAGVKYYATGKVALSDLLATVEAVSGERASGGSVEKYSGITVIVDAVPRGRTRGSQVDKYLEFKSLLGEIPAGKVARIAVPRVEYRRFSAGVRAAAIRMERVATALYKQGAAWVSWSPLNAASRPRRRGARRRSA